MTKKKRKNTKAIGNSYEREIAKKLSKWLSGSDKELVCWRSPHSGSISSIRKKKGLSGKNVDGDIQCLDLKYQEFFDNIYVDSKSLTKCNLFLINPKNHKSNKLLNEWQKVCKDADKKIPMMLVKLRDNKGIPDFIMLPAVNTHTFNNYISYDFMLHGKKESIIVLIQDEFFNTHTWKSLINLYKIYNVV